MADHDALPRPYLEQLVFSLREAGLVTTRARHGGYQLTRDRRHQDGRGLRALEGPLAPWCAPAGATHAQLCGRAGFCNVNHLWVTSECDQHSARLDHFAISPSRAQPPLPFPAGRDRDAHHLHDE